MIIAVIGDSSCSPEEAKLAESVGELLAQRGATIVCGGIKRLACVEVTGHGHICATAQCSAL